MSLFDASTWSGNVFTGEWRPGGGDAIAVSNPATGERIGEVGGATVEDVRSAALRAADAQRAWGAAAPAERAAVLRRAGELIEAHSGEIVGLVMAESGSIEAKAGLEVGSCAAECFDAAGLPTAPLGEVLASNDEHWSFSRRVPAGVVSVISPFNFPMLLSMRSVAPALALGNSVLLKPDPRTPLSGGLVIARIFELAGVPAGVLQVLPGGAEVGEAVVVAPEVRVISFTGSTRAGRIVGEVAARHLKRAHLELGGNSALVVLPGADVAAAASAGAFGSYLHQGQICMATGRHLVHESLVDEYVAALAEKAAHLPVGDPASGAVALGPIIDDRQVESIAGVIERSVTAGAVVVAGGTHEGRLFSPTVLTGVTAETPAWNEEIFGPVAPVRSFRTLEEAAEIVNDSEYGLSVGILGEVGEAMRLADLVHSGKIHINEQTVADEANAPFGGVGASGTGSRFGGHTANIEAFTETQWVTVRPEIAPYPF
ncbi:MAG: aldehyde dehydrogenase family protein [Leucobacter sp.]